MTIFEKTRSVGVIPVLGLRNPDTAEQLAAALIAGGIPAIEVTLRNPAAVECLSRIKKAYPDMICGAGTIGLMVLKVCTLLKAQKIIVVDLSEERLALAKQHGADLTINGRDDIDAVLTAAGLRNSIDIAVEAVGVTPTAQQTVEFVRNCGTVIWIGNNAPNVTVNMQSIVTRELKILGSYIYTEADFRECVRLLSEKPQDFTGIISAVIPVEQAQEAFEELSYGATAKIKVLVDMRL